MGEGGASASEPGRQHYALAVGRVRHAGEAVAAVIATSEGAAYDGAEAVAVDWEPLPAVTDMWAAMAEGAPQIHGDAPKNIEHQNQIKTGDPDAAFAAARRVVKQRMVSQRLCGVPIEPRACVAAPDPLTAGSRCGRPTRRPTTSAATWPACSACRSTWSASSTRTWGAASG